VVLWSEISVVCSRNRIPAVLEIMERMLHQAPDEGVRDRGCRVCAWLVLADAVYMNSLLILLSIR